MVEHSFSRFIELCWQYHFFFVSNLFVSKQLINIYSIFNVHSLDTITESNVCVCFCCSNYIIFFALILCIGFFVCISELLAISTFLFCIYSNFKWVNATRFLLQILMFVLFIHDYSLYVNLFCIANDVGPWIYSLPFSVNTEHW